MLHTWAGSASGQCVLGFKTRCWAGAQDTGWASAMAALPWWCLFVACATVGGAAQCSLQGASCIRPAGCVGLPLYFRGLLMLLLLQGQREAHAPVDLHPALLS